MPTVVRIARELYALRLEELKKAINQDEEKFLHLISEIDDIRAGKWDNQLLGLPETPLKEEEQPQQQPQQELKVEETENEPNLDLNEKETNLEEKAQQQQQRELSEVEDAQDEIEAEERRKVEADNLEEESRQIREATPDPVIDTTLEQQSTTYLTPVDTADPLLKRPVDDESVTEEPPLKRQKLEGELVESSSLGNVMYNISSKL